MAKQKTMRYTYKGWTLQQARKHNLPEVEAILNQFKDYEIESITIEIDVTKIDKQDTQLDLFTNIASIG